MMEKLKPFIKFIVMVFLALGFTHLSKKNQSVTERSMGSIQIQNGGRLKPYETFAKESLSYITGKSKWNEKSATEIVTTWFMAPEIWEKQKIFKVDHHELKNNLKIPLTQKYYSASELIQNPEIENMFKELDSQQARNIKFGPYFQAVSKLRGQLELFRWIQNGELIRVVPSETKDGSWISINGMEPPFTQKFGSIAKTFIKSISEKSEIEAAGSLEASVMEWKELLLKERGESLESERKISSEVFLNQFHPFRRAWVAYLLASLCLIMMWIFSKSEKLVNNLKQFSWFFIIVGFGLHIFGFALRCYITGRPPVSNMYETVLWVPFGAVFFALIFAKVLKTHFVLLASTLICVLCLVLSDLAPTILDPSLGTLEPVLRSNFWLLIHVLTITISYSAFFLSFVLGDISLGYFIAGKSKSKDVKELTKSIYRSLQVGVVLLTAGTILGGVWADYSWGRFWGWDPKETWAFIALMGYLALLHARLTGWAKDFGMAAGSIVAFSLVIMAWYGVNFVLGAGLHSYGFGAGGVEYVAGFVAIHFVYVAIAYAFYKKKSLK